MAQALLISISVIVFITFIIVKYQKNLLTGNQVMNNVKAFAPAILEPSPTPKVLGIRSSNADKKLFMNTSKLTDGSTNYIFTVGDMNGGNQKPLFSQNLSSTSYMTIPYNAWSPDDKLVFLSVVGPGTAINYLVMKADGSPITSAEQYFDVKSIFSSKNELYTLREATGWASETLLILYTYQKDGSKGPAFWLEIPSKAVLQLAR